MVPIAKILFSGLGHLNSAFQASNRICPLTACGFLNALYTKATISCSTYTCCLFRVADKKEYLPGEGTPRVLRSVLSLEVSCEGSTSYAKVSIPFWLLFVG